MGKVRVVTDSAADLSYELLEKHAMKAVPLTVTFGTEEFKDGVDLTKAEFLQKLQTSPVMPFSTQPSPADFIAAYEQMRDEGAEHVISVHLSSKLSGTFQSASLAAAQVSGITVHPVDTLSASLGVGMLAMEAAEMAAQGESPARIVQRLEHLREQIGLFFLVDTLEYLAKNGRIGKAQALLGGVLNVKPVLTIQEGVVTPIGKARGRRKAEQMVLDNLQRHVGDKRFTCIIVHSSTEEDAETWKQTILERHPQSDVTIHMLGSTIATHTGPGTIGVFALVP